MTTREKVLACFTGRYLTTVAGPSAEVVKEAFVVIADKLDEISSRVEAIENRLNDPD